MSTVELHPIARLPEEWAKEMPKLGGRAFNAAQVFKWVHARGVTDPHAMSDLSLAMRTKLAESGMGPVAEVASVRRASDGTRKALIRLAGDFNVETVLIPGVGGPRAQEEELDADVSAADDDGEEDDDLPMAAAPRTRISQCISTQVGCAMGCVFCASGVAGLKRHMTAAEIVSQVLLGRAMLDDTERLRNVVYMGMGEPLHNYEEVARSLRLLTHKEGIALPARRITVSTSGLVPEIRKLGADFHGQIGLAVSLHASDDETRSRMMPINKKYPIAELLKALRDYPLPPRRRITIEYTLIHERNDNTMEAKKLAHVLKGLKVKVNLIPMNPISASTLGPSDDRRVQQFKDVLLNAGYDAFVRRRRGEEVDAACGQLALLGAKPKVRVNRD